MKKSVIKKLDAFEEYVGSTKNLPEGVTLVYSDGEEERAIYDERTRIKATADYIQLFMEYKRGQEFKFEKKMVVKVVYEDGHVEDYLQDIIDFYEKEAKKTEEEKEKDRIRIREYIMEGAEEIRRNQEKNKMKEQLAKRLKK